MKLGLAVLRECADIKPNLVGDGAGLALPHSSGQAAELRGSITGLLISCSDSPTLEAAIKESTGSNMGGSDWCPWEEFGQQLYGINHLQPIFVTLTKCFGEQKSKG